MKEIKTLPGTLFLLWFVGSPFITIVLFITFNDQLRYNFFWLLGVVSAVLAIIGILVIKFSGRGIWGDTDKKFTKDQLVLWLFIIYLIFSFFYKQLWIS